MLLTQDQARARVSALIDVWYIRSRDLLLLPSLIADALDGTGWEIEQVSTNDEGGRVILRPIASTITIDFQTKEQHRG